MQTLGAFSSEILNVLVLPNLSQDFSPNIPKCTKKSRTSELKTNATEIRYGKPIYTLSNTTAIP